MPVGGPLWLDKHLGHKKPLNGYHQIVGHTPVDDIQKFTINDYTTITYVDCNAKKKQFLNLIIDEKK